MARINFMDAFNRALIEETPGKIMGLLAASLFSLAFLFAVSVSDASFAGYKGMVWSPFAPEKVVSVIDHTVAAYSNFISQNVLNPLVQDYAVYSENAQWVFEESGLTKILGMSSPTLEQPRSQFGLKFSGQVAGAKVQGPYSTAHETVSVDTLYKIIFGQ